MELKNKDVHELFQKIINKKVNYIGRAVEMLMLGLGKEIDDVDYKGRPVKKSEYAIHLQCFWRIKNKNNQIIVAYYDMFEPKSSVEWSEDFDWDIQGNNLYDEKVKKWMTNYDRYVVEYKVNSNLDLTLTFNTKEQLEVLIDTTAKKECWRLLEYKGEHVVASGVDIYIDDEKVYEVGQNLLENNTKSNLLDWNNSECETTYGTTFTDHGSHHEVTNMMIKARQQGYQLGQWTDDKRAAEFIAKIAKERGVGVHDVPLPRTALEGFPSVVYLSTGMKDCADKARIIVNEDGSVKTAYPFSSAYPL